MIMRFTRQPTTKNYTLMRIMRRFLILRQISIRMALRIFIRTPTSIIVTTRVVRRPTIFKRQIRLISLILRRTRITTNRHTPRISRSKSIMRRITLKNLKHTRMNNRLLKNRSRLTLGRRNQTSTFRGSTRRTRSNISLQRITTVNTGLLPSMQRNISTRRLSARINRTRRTTRRNCRRLQITMIRIPLRQMRLNRRPLIRLLVPNRITKHNIQRSLQRVPIMPIKSNTIQMTRMVILVLKVTNFNYLNPTINKNNIIRRRISTRASTNTTRLLNRHNRIFINTRLQIRNVRILSHVTAIIIQIQRIGRQRRIRMNRLLLLRMQGLINGFLRITNRRINMRNRTRRVTTLMPTQILLTNFIRALRVNKAIDMNYNRTYSRYIRNIIVIV